jgi:ribosomal protein L11 methyltransferase
MGSGSHSTTRLCLQLLEKHITPGCHVLDLGCGTGVLSIAAAKLGAGQVLAADIDAAAVDITGKNVALNGVGSTVETRLAGLESAQPALYDGLVANLLTPIILSLAPRGLCLPLKPGGWAIFSGVLGTQTEPVRNALNAHGFTVSQIHVDGQWTALESTRIA